jgi:uncharacterized Zn finger protein
VARIEVDEETLRQLAGEDTFQRGTVLHRDGLVDGVTIDGTIVNAIVASTPPCRVELRVGLGGLTGRGDCPAAIGGDFCEHCVATGLTWLDRNATPEDAEVYELGSEAQRRKRPNRGSPNPDISVCISLQ